MATNPPQIRDERRDSDLIRIKERLAVVEKDTDRQEKLVNGMHYALFGIPEDRTNNGLVGTMAEIKDTQKKIQGTLIGLLVTVVGGVSIELLVRAAG